MGFKCGIVGLPNVGKSTLFNALTQSNLAQAANFPFCTIKPNIANVVVPDNRIKLIANIENSKNIIFTYLTFVDIAGLVKGASKGEGLGNQFLANILEVDIIAYVLRCFKNNNITHVEGNIDPLYDAEIVETELILADIMRLEKEILIINKKFNLKDNKIIFILNIIENLLILLNKGKPARYISLYTNEEKNIVNSLNLLTSKPILYICNVDENSFLTGNNFSKEISKKAKKDNSPMVIISAKIESEISILNIEEKKEFMTDLGMIKSGLDNIINIGYTLLNLQTYFTAGIKETRAWTIKKGTLAPKAAAMIHSDFERGFICTECVSYIDYIKFRGEHGCRKAGKYRIEGKNYIVQNGDILHFRFNV